MKWMKKFLFLCVTFIFFSCARAPLRSIENSMRPAKILPQLVDCKSSESFFLALKNHIDVMKRSKQVTDPMIFGKLKISKEQYINSLLEILNHPNNWVEWIELNFDVYEVYGKDDWAEVLTTGYYEPHVHGAHEKSVEYPRAIYSLPGNKEINFSRKEIDSENKLADKKLEMAWLDPVDAFFIQIQGSGVIEFDDGSSLHIGFASNNGHPYRSIGKSLTDVIALPEMSMQRIRAYLKTLSSEKQQEILNQNPSYVYFKKLDSEALTYAGMNAVAGRTMATDFNFFPKGALAFLDIEEPMFDSSADLKPIAWKKKSRFVFDQDTGGAIRGGGRVDLFFGNDEHAYQKAGVMKQMGKLYYLVPKSYFKH